MDAVALQVQLDCHGAENVLPSAQSSSNARWLDGSEHVIYPALNGSDCVLAFSIALDLQPTTQQSEGQAQRRDCASKGGSLCSMLALKPQ